MPTTSDVAHLFRRAAFGVTNAQAQSLSAQALDSLVDGLLNAPPDPDSPPPIYDDSSKSQYEQVSALQRWWYDRMSYGNSPLIEKMTLFWHGHFCAAQQKVYNHRHMYGLNSTTRANALGSFRTLAQAIALQPAMLRYLDNDTNVVGHAQENFARELWELFMLGVGNYSQNEVVASAQAWTGHGLSADKSSYVFYPDRHDNGAKTIFGSTQNFDGPGVIDWTLDGPRKMVAAKFIVRKLWTFFAYANPEVAVVDGLAQVLASSNWDLKATMRALLLRPEFYSAQAKSGLVRSPSEFIAAVLTATGYHADDVNPQWFAARMGQELFDPPDVSGWKTNAYWISGTAFLGRATFARHVTWGSQKKGLLANVGSLSPADAVNRALDVFSILEPSAQTRQALVAWVQSERDGKGWAEEHNLITLSMLTPEFSLA